MVPCRFSAPCKSIGPCGWHDDSVSPRGTPRNYLRYRRIGHINSQGLRILHTSPTTASPTYSGSTPSRQVYTLGEHEQRKTPRPRPLHDLHHHRLVLPLGVRRPARARTSSDVIRNLRLKSPPETFATGLQVTDMGVDTLTAGTGVGTHPSQRRQCT